MQILDSVDYDDVPELDDGRLTFNQRTPLNDMYKTRVRVLRPSFSRDLPVQSVPSTFHQKHIFSQASGDPYRFSGMYKRARSVKAPVATSSSVNFEAANRKISLSGREFVTTLFSGATTTTAASQFTSTQALLRPTDFTLFSWLSGIAAKFEEYRFTRIQFVYEPQCPTTTAGSVALWFDEDPTHTAPSNWNSMINTGANVHGAPWVKHVFVVPAHMYNSRRKYYTKSEFGDLAQQQSMLPTTLTTGNFASATDPMEYYCGLYGFASQDVGPTTAASAGNALGKIYLDYSLVLMTQNTDNWTETSLLQQQISTQVSDNSGSGAFWQLPTGSTALAISQGTPNYYRNLLQGVLPATSVVSYAPGIVASGAQYFNLQYDTRFAQAVWVARQNLELKFFVGITLSANLSGTNATYGNYFIRYIPKSGFINGKACIDVIIGSTVTQASIVTANPVGVTFADITNVQYGIFNPLYQLSDVSATPASLATSKNFIQCYQMRFYPGDKLFFGPGDSVNTDTVTQFSMFITPMAFGLNN